jgi:RNA polymerase sigma-70 factor (ECF subfamily)
MGNARPPGNAKGPEDDALLPHDEVDDGRRFVRAFVAALPPALRARLDGPTVAAALSARFAAARASWPTVALPPERFAAFVAKRVPPDAADGAPLAELAVEELYLTCACARGDAEALRVLEARYFPRARAALAGLRLDPSAVDELVQRLRVYLFVDPGDGRPRIVQFRGRGTLGSWLGVSAVRAAYKLLERETRERTNEDERLARVAAREHDQEVLVAKGRYGEAFRAAFAAALGSLEDRDKNLLRQHYLDGLSTDQLGALYRTHRTTITRWLGAAKQRLLDRTRSYLMSRLRVPLADCDSIIRLVESQLDVTLYRLFAGDPSG